MSSESTLCTELLLDVALDTEETLLTLRDLDTHKYVCTHVAPKERRPVAKGHGGPVTGVHVHLPQPPVSRNMFHQTGDFRGTVGGLKVPHGEGTPCHRVDGPCTNEQPLCLLGRDV